MNSIDPNVLIAALSLFGTAAGWLWRQLRKDQREQISRAARSAFELAVLRGHDSSVTELQSHARTLAGEALQLIGVDAKNADVQAWIEYEVNYAAAALRPQQLIEARLRELGKAATGTAAAFDADPALREP